MEFRAAATQQDATSATAVDGMLSQLINADAARPRAPAAAVVGEAAAQHVAEEGMRPAAALVAAAPLAASPAAAALATSAGAAGGAAHTTAAAAGGGGMGSGGASEGVAVAFKDGQGQPPADQAVVVQPAEAPRPSDVAEELARMAREVRMQVKDVTIRIDTVLGTGAFGVVYGGEGVLNCCIMYTALCAWQRRWPCTYATMCVLHSPKDASLGAFRIRPRSGTRCLYRHLAGHSRSGEDGDHLGVTRATQARAT